MLRTSLAALLVLSVIAAAQADALSSLRGQYSIAPSSQIAFSVAGLGDSINGAFSHFSGAFDLHPENVAASRVDFSLEPGSVLAGEPRIENFLRSSAVFDVAEHPVISFHSTGVRQNGLDSAVIKGALTVRGITRRETFRAVLVGRQGRTVVFHVTGDVLRSPYGMDAGTPIYSNVVHFDMMLRGERK